MKITSAIEYMALKKKFMPKGFEISEIGFEAIALTEDLIQKVKDEVARLWYAEQAILQGWSRPILERHIKDTLYKRQANASTKASRTK